MNLIQSLLCQGENGKFDTKGHLFLPEIEMNMYRISLQQKCWLLNSLLVHNLNENKCVCGCNPSAMDIVANSNVPEIK